MSQDDKTWVNQQLMFYKDNLFGSDGSLEVSLATSTQDFKNFSPVNLNVSVISNNNRRLINLSYQNSVDLILTFQDIMKNLDFVFDNGRNNEIVKKYHNDRNLKIEFKLTQNKERVVIISVIHTNSDYTRVIIPYFVFSGFSKMVNTFACDFIKINFELVNRTLLSEVLNSSKQIQNGIRVLPTMIVNAPPSVDSGLMSCEEIIEPQKTEPLEEFQNDAISEFDKFLGPDMSNIKLEGVEEKISEPPTKIEDMSDFISKVLKGDLTVLEDMLNSFSMSRNPFDELIKTINQVIPCNLIPAIKPADYNSICYLSKIYQNTTIKEYTLKGIPITGAVPVLRYELEDKNAVTAENLDLAYDILTIILYMRSFKGLIEKKVDDCFNNKTIFMLNVRLFLDSLCFSFLNDKDPEIIKSAVFTRFKKYENSGFFKKYNETLDMYGIPKVSERDISQILSVILDKVIGKCKDISVVHSESYSSDNLKLPYDSNFSLEQIINYVIPIETMKNIGNETTKEALDVEVGENIPEGILDLFKDGVKKQVKEKKEKETNIVRFAKANDTDIPKTYRAEMINHLKEIDETNYDLNSDIFPIEEIGEILVKALYEWNESNVKKEPYTDFFYKATNTLMTKELIVAKIKAKSTKSELAEESWINDLDLDSI